MRTIQISVIGVPKPQPRPRARKAGKKARVFDPGTAENWKNSVALAANAKLPPRPLEGPIAIDVVYTLPRPKRLMRKCDPIGMIRHITKPDVDNLNKALIDALTDIRMWRDDNQVCELRAAKYYAAKDGRPGARIRIEVIEN